MSPPGRPKGEYRSAQREGTPVTRRPGIIALAPNEWRGQWVNRQQLLSRIGRRWEIAYSNGAWLKWDAGTPEWQAAPWLGAFTRENDVWVDDAPRWLMRWPRIGPWDRFAVRYQVARLRQRLQMSGASVEIAHICHPAFFPYVGAIGARRLVYHVYDLFDRQPGWSDELARAERELLDRADLVVVPSDAVASELDKRVARRYNVLLNAADVPVFLAAARNPPPEPADLAAIPHPRIGYLGSLHPQIDYALMLAIARARPACHWVLVGPRQRQRDLVSNPDFNALLALPNVHELGSKDRNAVPHYTVRMDVNVMIYQTGDASWTRVAYPLKVHEYLASGKPLVSVGMEPLRPLAEVIRFASGVEDWIAAIDEALTRGGVGSQASRQAAADGHSWDARADVLDRWLRELIDQPASARAGRN